MQPEGGGSPEHVAIDQKHIRVNDEEYWLYATANPETDRFLYVRLFPTYTNSITREFIVELAAKHDIEDAIFLIDDARELKGALRREGLTYWVEIHCLRNKIERVFREVERQTSSFLNCFSHAEPATMNSWLQAFAA